MAPSHEASDASSSSLRIKGYLPVRLRFPSSDNNNSTDNNHDETFFYVKEHYQPGSSSSSSSSSTDTLFVANCPVHPRVSSKLLLQSCLGRYGDVRRVTVIAHPRRSSSTNNKHKSPSSTSRPHDHSSSSSETAAAVEEQDAETMLGAWTTKFSAPSFLPKSYSSSQNEQPELAAGGAVVDDNGKFAHVAFASARELKQTVRTLTEIMAGNDSDGDDNDNNLPALKIDTVELQTLADGELDELEEESNYYDNSIKSDSGVLAVAARYRASCRPFLLGNNNNAALLLEECNDVVQAFEDAEEEERRRRQAAAAQPDDDGFVTVAYSSTVATAHKQALEDPTTAAKDAGARGGRRKKTSRSRPKKKNKLGGADPLPDFYRFQTKENRKRSLQELRQRFEEDLAKVKRLKEERQYQPFT